MSFESLDMTRAAEVFAVVMREKSMSLSDREWKHRLLGHGYRVEDTGEGVLITSAARGERICMLPQPVEA